MCATRAKYPRSSSCEHRLRCRKACMDGFVRIRERRRAEEGPLVPTCAEICRCATGNVS